MTSNELRSSFLKFFEERGHTIVPSMPVIPYADETLLFTNAGMNQFKDVFLGVGKREYVRAANSQKCIRVSGKHNDLEEVGGDTYHHTFFEMLGNWSFGDYYKKEAIEWAWELLTRVWGVDKKRLYVTVFESDDESEEYWKKVTDIQRSHIFRFGKKDNFWEMGDTGPCGPCSEIHIDLTPDFSGGKLVNAGDPRVMEIWNLVFIQYDRDASGNLTVLPAKHIDTGMGLERLAAVLQGKKSNYDTDVFSPIIQKISDLTGKQYDGKIISDYSMQIGGLKSYPDIVGANPQSQIDIAMRVIADHVRMLSFSIADGGIPSNEGRGYVMRRILRRAARFGRTLGMHEPFIYKIVDAVVKSMGKQYIEIEEKQSLIERVIKGEEESFNVALERGLEIFDSVIKRIGHSKTFPGEEAFKLYDTYGFPLDLTELMARERGLVVDVGMFTALMEEQRERARKSASRISQQKNWGIEPNFKKRLEGVESHFVGYNVDEYEGLIYDIGPNFVLMNYTPFYPESGGQVGDTGTIEAADFLFTVENTKRDGPLIVHYGRPHRLYEFEEVRGKKVRAVIDKQRRRNIERNHTATHIVHEALRMVLGEHLHQQGSLVAPDYLRFDFNHFEKITSEQINAIENIVNEKIAEGIEVYALNDPKDWLTIEEAKKRYPKLKMFFGEKYEDKVRVVEIKDFTWELCGGTHVKNTRDIQLFKIISESSIASGIRRIEAVTGNGLRKYLQQQIQKINELDEHLSKLIEEKEILEKELGQYKKVELMKRPSLGIITLPQQITMNDVIATKDAQRLREEAIEEVTKATLNLRKELNKYRVSDVSGYLDKIVQEGILFNGFKVISARVDVSGAEELKNLGDYLRGKLSSGVGVLGAVVNDKVALVCVVTDDLIKEKKLQAGKIVGELAKYVDGGGGGRPHLATAGGKSVSKLDEALQQIVVVLRTMLSK